MLFLTASIKGHFGQLLKELPFLLKDEIRDTCTEIIKSTTTDKMTGADFRISMIQVYLYLLEQDIPLTILKVVETAVAISKLFVPSRNSSKRVADSPSVQHHMASP